MNYEFKKSLGTYSSVCNLSFDLTFPLLWSSNISRTTQGIAFVNNENYILTRYKTDSVVYDFLPQRDGIYSLSNEVSCHSRNGILQWTIPNSELFTCFTPGFQNEIVLGGARILSVINSHYSTTIRKIDCLNITCMARSKFINVGTSDSTILLKDPKTLQTQREIYLSSPVSKIVADGFYIAAVSSYLTH
jgi:hypothetical protein